MHRDHVTVRIEDHPELTKEGGAIINNDKVAYQAALVRRNAAKDKAALLKRLSDLEAKYEVLRGMVEALANGNQSD